MKINTKNIILLLILVVASVLRLYKLGSIPPHLTPDEASLGYNAYSILKTGRDEHGAMFPIIFESFGDNKPGLYIYATVPSVAVFGLNEFSTRLPGAILGIISVFLIYKLALELFKKEKLALIVSFFLAVSPWHMFFSRGAWEINLALTLTLLGSVFFLKSFKNPKYLFLAAIAFALTLLAYQGAKLSTSIVIILLTAINWKKVLSLNKKAIVGGVISGIVVSMPVILSLFTGRATRLAIFSVFSYPRPESYLKGILDQGGEQANSLSYYFFHSEWMNFLRGILGRFSNHFSGRFLFFEGDFSNPRHSAPYAGMLTIFDLPLLIIGVFTAIKERVKSEHWFILGWLILAPLPAILSRDQVHAVRSFNMVVPLTFVVAFGVYFLFEKLKSKKIVLGILACVYFAGFIYYLDAYFIHLPKLNSKYWEYGYKQIVETVTPLENKYSKIIVQQSYAQPYIFFLFFNKYDPAKYQAISGKNYVASLYGDVGQVTYLDNIYFEGVDWQALRGKSGTLIVADTVRIPEEDSKEGDQFHIVGNIKYLDGNTAFRVIEIK